MIERDTPAQRLYVQQDLSWGVTGLVSPSGAVLERYLYDPYGDVNYLTAGWNSQSGSNYAWHYLFQGGRLDAECGTYNFERRDFSPTAGRWLEIDPMRYDAGDNDLYRFVKDMPISATDPAGTDIYLVSGNNSTDWHQDIVVDIWHLDKKTGKYVYINKWCFSFGDNRFGIVFRNTWLGMPSTVWCDRIGTVYRSAWTGKGQIDRVLHTSVEQDMRFFRLLKTYEGMEDGYSLIRHNCRVFSQMMYEKAAQMCHEK